MNWRTSSLTLNLQSSMSWKRRVAIQRAFQKQELKAQSIASLSSARRLLVLRRVLGARTCMKMVPGFDGGFLCRENSSIFSGSVFSGSVFTTVTVSTKHHALQMNGRVQ